MTTPDRSDTPTELIESLIVNASADADRVGVFLNSVGLGPLPDRPRALPADFLLNLGAALRLVNWEVTGITIHLEAGLPSAQDAVRQVFLDAAAKVSRIAPPDPWLSRAVCQLTIDRLAWTGRRDLDSEIVINVSDEDALVESLARFAWAHRTDGPSTGKGPQR